MKTILFAILQVILASGILYGYYHLMLRNKRFHQYNRFYLLAAVITSVLVPFLNIPVYFSDENSGQAYVLQTLNVISSPGFEESTTPVIVENIQSSAVNWFSLQYIVYSLYILMVFIFLFRMILSVRKIKIISSIYPFERIGNINFVNTNEPGTPFSFFRWLFWNREIELNSDKGQQIFRHELFHIQQRHSADILFMELITAFAWFNPFFYLIKKELKAIHEFLADEFAINKTGNWEYAELLLMQALSTKHQLVNPFFHNQIKRRIAMITNPKKTSHRYLRKLLVLPVTAFVLILFAFKYKHKDVDAVEKCNQTATIVVDAAHGGIDPGAKSADGKFTEAYLALEIAKTIKELSKEYNINVIMTRESDILPGNATNKADGLKRRVEICEKTNPDVFISLHMNAATENSAVNKGFDAYITGKKESEESKKLAESILKNVSSIYSASNQPKQRQESGVYVLDKNNYPAVILQCGYITNPEDIAFITNRENQETLARSILTAVVRYKNQTFERANAFIDTLPKPHTKGPFFYSAPDNLILEADTLIYHPYPLKNKIDIGKALVIINNKKQETGILKKNTVISKIITFYEKGNAEAIRQFGQDAKNGVIVFEEAVILEIPPTEFYKEDILKVSTRKIDTEVDNKIFEKVEINPAFPGGDAAWRKYLERNLNPSVPIQNRAPRGTYTVYIQFVVRKDGSVSEVRPLTNHGFGMEEEAIKIIKKGPAWLPAIQNGQAVNAYRKQPVTFVVGDGKTASTPATNSNNILNGVVVVGYSDNVIYDKVEIEPAFPGGEIAFRKYVTLYEARSDRQFEYSTFIGSVTVEFIVDVDGTISDIKALEGAGKSNYGKAAVDLIKKGPKWIPAIQNGKNVRAYKRQRVDFTGANQKTTTQSIPLEKVRSIEQGKTLLSDVQSMFGEPVSKSIENNMLLWNYENSASRLIVQFSGRTEAVTDFRFMTVANPKRENIEYEKAKTIKENETTFAQLEKLLGQPYHIEISNNEEFWTYEGFNSKLSVMSKERRKGVINIVVYNSSVSKDENKEKGKVDDPLIINAANKDYYISLKDLQQATPYDLLRLDRETEISQFAFGMETAEGNIDKAMNTGKEFNNRTKELIVGAKPGRTFFLEKIIIVKDGAKKKLPAILYHVTN